MIENWKHAYKMHSVQLAALIAIVAGLEPLIPELHGKVPHWVVSVAAVLVVVARLMRQGSLKLSCEESKPSPVKGVTCEERCRGIEEFEALPHECIQAATTCEESRACEE